MSNPWDRKYKLGHFLKYGGNVHSIFRVSMRDAIDERITEEVFMDDAVVATQLFAKAVEDYGINFVRFECLYVHEERKPHTANDQ